MEGVKLDKSALKGVIDTHIHTAPDAFRVRKFTDIELAQDAHSVGAKAVVIKSHVVETAARAKLVSSMYTDLKVFGGVALNEWTGGLNPKIVEATLNLGGKIVWLPTLSARHEHEAYGKRDGIYCLDDNDHVVPELVDILKLIADAGAILGTGHVSYKEELNVIRKAKDIGLKNIIVNHPELYRVSLSIEQHKELLQYGVYFERNYGGSKFPIDKVFHKHMPQGLANIKAIGAESTIIGTDVGQPNCPNWSDAYLEYMQYLEDNGISKQDIDLMTKINPAKLLNI